MKKYAFWVKCLTFVLCVVLLLGVAVSGLGVLFAGSAGMYNFSNYESWISDQYYSIASNIAFQVMQSYGTSMSEVPQWLLEQSGYAYGHPMATVEGWYELAGNEWYYMITDSKGNVVAGSESANVTDPMLYGFDNISANYLEIVGREARELPTAATEEPSWPATETTIAPSAIEPTIVPSEYAYSETYWDPYTGEAVYVMSRPIEGHHVTVGITKNYVGYRNYSGLPQSLWQWLFSVRMALIAAIAISFCLFAAAFVFQMIIAGRDPKTGEVIPKALNRIPLDLYLAAAFFGTALGCIGVYELLDILFYEDSGYNVLFILLICGCGVAVATLDMGFFTALAAQFKTPGGYLIKNSICGRILRWLWKGLKLVNKGIRKVLAVVPLTWEWLLIGAVLAIGTLTNSLISLEYGTAFPLFLWCLVGIAVISYGGWCYGNIRKGIQRMCQGNLYEKIDTKYMYGSFRAIAEELNVLADVAAIAAEKQLKAERMKAELVTNVSHDIKTPLTSVINYVDLLQQPHTEEEGTQYLEVLSRQSARLKRLVEDLMDMSKASTGNMSVNATALDAVEAVNQALGEFADKLAVNQLTPVFRCPMEQMHMYADGRITWRVLSNLLGNVVKYALPGTRVYLDLNRQNKCVVLSIKNISREELNITAEELTERFVRGDASRNTEGSGLGLNIAQSLMRLQRGDMELTVDGDLFKVTLTFSAD